MRWRHGARPQPGLAPRYRTVFAWRPVRCDDGFTRWMERVVAYEIVARDQRKGRWVWEPQSYYPLDKFGELVAGKLEDTPDTSPTGHVWVRQLPDGTWTTTDSWTTT